MSELTVYDPALCCSTGVCGPEVDPTLARFAGDVEWLRARGVEVRRYNLAQEAGAFAENPLVRRTLQREGVGCLPLVVTGGEIVSRGRYPERAELAAWCGLADGGVPAAAPASPAGAAYVREATGDADREAGRSAGHDAPASPAAVTPVVLSASEGSPAAPADPPAVVPLRGLRPPEPGGGR